jgi:Na+-driven multidrug efflux pump
MENPADPKRRGRGRAAKTVEVFGWLVLTEGVVVLFAPHHVASVLHIPPLAEQAANYFRLVGLLACGIGMLYAVSGRLNAEGFVIASLLDRPLVPPVMAGLWLLGIVPGPLALVISAQDFGGFLWTLAAWRADRRERQTAQTTARA